MIRKTRTAMILMVALLPGCAAMDMLRRSEMPPEVAAADPDRREVVPAAELPELPELPELAPDWTPPWWDDPLTGAFAPMPFPDLLSLLADTTLVKMAPDVFADWISDASTFDQEAAPRTTAPLPAHLATKGEAVVHLCALYDYHCVMDDDGALSVMAHAMRRYHLSAQPGESSGSMGVEGLSESTGQSNATMANNPYTTTLLPAVQLIMDQPAALGGRYLLSAETNTLFVFARPSIQKQIATLVHDLNSSLALAVRVHVSIFEIERDRNFGFRLLPGWRETSLDAAAGESTTVQTIINEALERSTLDVTYRVASAAHSFSVALNALAAISDTKVVFSETLETRNNVIITSQNTRSAGYVRSITRNREQIGQNVETTYQVDIEDIETGWSVSALPTVAPNDLITIRIAISRNDLVSITAYDLGEGASGNTFTIDRTNRQMAITLRDGESRLVSALATERNQNTAGVVTKGNRKQGSEFAVLIAATVVDMF